MRSVNVAELQSNLGQYLTFAKAGESIVIQENDEVIARLVPSAEGRPGPDEGLMDAATHATKPRKSLDLEKLLRMPFPKVKGNAGTEALLAEREEGR